MLNHHAAHLSVCRCKRYYNLDYFRQQRNKRVWM